MPYNYWIKLKTKLKIPNKPAVDSDLTFVAEASSFGKDTECFESGVLACISSDLPTCLWKTLLFQKQIILLKKYKIISYQVIVSLSFISILSLTSW